MPTLNLENIINIATEHRNVAISNKLFDNYVKGETCSKCGSTNWGRITDKGKPYGECMDCGYQWFYNVKGRQVPEIFQHPELIKDLETKMLDLMHLLPTQYHSDWEIKRSMQNALSNCNVFLAIDSKIEKEQNRIKGTIYKNEWYNRTKQEIEINIQKLGLKKKEQLLNQDMLIVEILKNIGHCTGKMLNYYDLAKKSLENYDKNTKIYKGKITELKRKSTKLNRLLKSLDSLTLKKVTLNEVIKKVDDYHFKKYVDEPCGSHSFMDVTDVYIDKNQLVISTRIENITPLSYRSSFREGGTFRVTLDDSVKEYLLKKYISSRKDEVTEEIEATVKELIETQDYFKKSIKNNKNYLKFEQEFNSLLVPINLIMYKLEYDGIISSYTIRQFTNNFNKTIDIYNETLDKINLKIVA